MPGQHREDRARPVAGRRLRRGASLALLGKRGAGKTYPSRVRDSPSDAPACRLRVQSAITSRPVSNRCSMMAAWRAVGTDEEQGSRSKTASVSTLAGHTATAQRTEK